MFQDLERQEIEKERQEDQSALVSVDPFSRYLQTISKYPLLTDEEEKELFERVQKHRDKDAVKRLVTSHLRLVVKIAMEYRTAFQNLLDLIQEGNIGLLRAVEHFDPSRGARLSYYAGLWIRSYILKYILDNFRLIKIGTTQAQRKLFFNLMKEKEKLRLLGITPDAKLLADRLDVREEVVSEMGQRLAQSELSIDAPIGDEDGALYVDFLKSSGMPADEIVSEKEFQVGLVEKLEDFTKRLNPRELKIFRERLVSEVPKTLQDIANEYGITRERVRQIEEHIKSKLKRFFEESGFHPEL